MQKKVLLDQIKADIKAKNICPDLAKEATNLVMGVGNSDADIMFIGEAPGKNEDLQGQPFVGAAGKFLDEMLTLAGMKREDVYISNIVKYRPPNNRDPLPDEKKAFWPFLLREINVIRPKIIATLGRHSMEYFLPNMKISVIHGQPKRIKIRFSYEADNNGEDAVQGNDEKRTKPYQSYGEGASQAVTQQRASSDSSVASSARKQGITTVVILPLFHPAAALYNGSMRETLIEDFIAVPKIIELINQET